MACLKTCKKRQDLFSAEQSEIENNTHYRGNRVYWDK